MALAPEGSTRNMKPSVESGWSGAPVDVDGAGMDDPDVAALLVQADVLLADLESRSLGVGQGAALPFLGLARFELSATDLPPVDSHGVIPPTYEAVAARVEQLLGQALSLSSSLAGCLHILRAQGLLREHDRWARGVSEVGGAAQSLGKPARG